MASLRDRMRQALAIPPKFPEGSLVMFKPAKEAGGRVDGETYFRGTIIRMEKRFNLRRYQITPEDKTLLEGRRMDTFWAAEKDIVIASNTWTE